MVTDPDKAAKQFWDKVWFLDVIRPQSRWLTSWGSMVR